MAEFMKKLYQRALVSGMETDKKAYKDLDKRIKSYVKKMKSHQRRHLAEQLENGK